MINFMRKLGDNRTVGTKGGRCMGAERRPRERQGEPTKTEKARETAVEPA